MTRCGAPEHRQGHECVPAKATSARRGIAVLAAALALGACDFPTAPPIFETRFVIPESGTTLSVNQLLPTSVTPVAGAFRIAVAPVGLNRTLGQMCGAPCLNAQGQQIPKPAFTDAFALSLTMPADVQSATLSAGSVTLNMSHNFGFDPLRPAGAATNGTMTVTIRNAGRQLGSVVIDQAFPSGTTINRIVGLAAGNLTGNIEVDISVTSPAGGQVTINTASTMNISVTPGNMDVTQAAVRVQNRAVSAAAVTMDLSGVDDAVADRVRSGAIVLTMTNPLNITGTMQLQFQGAAVAPKSVQVAPGTTTQRVEFTQAELQQLLGRVVTLNISGPVTGGGAGSTVTVMPGQQVTVNTLIDLIIAIGA
jgi:hypothetical protein